MKLSALPAWLGVLLPVLLCSCASPGSDSFASVTIPRRTTAEIHAATRRVFTAEGFRESGATSGDLAFEKRGTSAQNLVHGSLGSAADGSETWVRVRLKLEYLGDGRHRLHAQAYMVPRHGDSFFEEEHRLTKLRRGPYQKLLDQVEASLR